MTGIWVQNERKRNQRKAVLKYNNRFTDDNDAKEVASDNNADSSVDPKYIALLTKMKELKELMHASSSFQTTARRFNGTIEKWRMSKDFGNKVTCDGQTWWWCRHHRLDGVFDKLYVTHPPKEHDLWQQQKTKREQRCKDKASTS